jgi:hypothetical protein
MHHSHGHMEHGRPEFNFEFGAPNQVYEAVTAPFRWASIMVIGVIILVIILIIVLVQWVGTSNTPAAFTPGCTAGMCGIKGYTRQRSVLQNMLEMTPLTFNDSH